MEMRNIIKEYMDFVEGRMANPELWKELGLDSEQAAEARANVNALLADWMTQCRNATDEIARNMDSANLGVLKDVMDTLKDGNPEGKDLILSVTAVTENPEAEIPAGAPLLPEDEGELGGEPLPPDDSPEDMGDIPAPDDDLIEGEIIVPDDDEDDEDEDVELGGDPMPSELAGDIVE
jgi:hypothetical protein